MPKTDTHTGEGRLIVRARTADGALPVSGATVTVRGAEPENLSFIQTLTTDQSGNTPILLLPAPDISVSLKPNGGKPYAAYDILVVKEGYHRHENLKVPIFDTVLSSQGANMIPLAPYDEENVFPSGNLSFTAGQALNGEVS